MKSPEEYEAVIEQQRRFILALADRIAAASEVLSRVAEKRSKKDAATVEEVRPADISDQSYDVLARS